MNLLGISSLFLANGTMVGMIVAIVVAALAVAAAVVGFVLFFNHKKKVTRPIKSLATRLKGAENGRRRSGRMQGSEKTRPYSKLKEQELKLRTTLNAKARKRKLNLQNRNSASPRGRITSIKGKIL